MFFVSVLDNINVPGLVIVPGLDILNVPGLVVVPGLIIYKSHVKLRQLSVAFHKACEYIRVDEASICSILQCVCLNYANKCGSWCVQSIV